MNPPTTGHQLLVNKLVAYARIHNAAPRVYLSHSVGPKDPLQYDKKITFARAAFGSLVKKSNARTVIEVLKQLEKEKFTHVTMFAGSDRVPEFTKLLQKYNGKNYNFEKIEVKSAGERDPDADDVSGMSASKMRALAKDEKISDFLRGAPNTLKITQAKNMYTAVRRALLGEDVMDYNHDDKFISFIIESSDDVQITIPSDSELAKHIEDLEAHEFDLDDADALMLDVILGQDVEKEQDDVNEAKVLSLQTRQKLSQRMKSMAKRLARLRDIKRKQMPATQRLRMRARKAALMVLRRRATGRKNLDYNALSRSQRIAVDNALVNRFGKGLNRAVDTISKRILPMIRKKAQTSVAQARDIKEQTLDPKTKKQVPDQKKDNPLNLDPLKLNVLDTDPQKNDRVAPNPDRAHLHKNRKATHFKTVDEGRKSASDKDARDAGDTNIIYQMRKVVNSRGEHQTTFADGNKVDISIADAKKLLAKFDALRLPADKHDFTVQAGKSAASFRSVLAHGLKRETGKKISLGGKPFKEFYLGVGRSRTVSAYDNDEPPGTRRVAEAKSVGGVDPDANDDPNVPRKPNPKLDLLLRLGLADTDELQKYRRALRSSKKQALASPEMRKKLSDLLDKLIDIITTDTATYSRVRYNVQKEAMALINKAEKSGVDVDIIFEVFSRGYKKNEDINEAFNRVNSFIAGGKAAEMDKDLTEKSDLPHKYRAGLSDKTAAARKSHWDKMNKLSDRDPRAYEPAPGDATAKTKPSKHTLKYRKMYGEEILIDEAAETGLAAKAKKSGVSLETLRKVYRRGVAAWNSGHRPGTTPQQWGMARVNSYITKGKGTYHGADKDLREDELNEKGPGLWANIHAKRERIKAGSGERMRKPGEKGAPTADQIRAAKEEIETEAKSNWDKQARFAKYDTIASRGSQKKSYVDRTITPMKSDEKQRAAAALRDFIAKGGSVKKIAPGKATIKSYVKPKKYMTPNQAAKVGVTEDNGLIESSAVLNLKKNLRIMKIKIPKGLHEGKTIKFDFIKARSKDEDYLNSSLLFNYMSMKYDGDNVRFLEKLDKVMRLGQHDIRLITYDGEYMDIKYGSLLKFAFKGTRLVALDGVPNPSIIGTGFIKDAPKAKLLSFSQKKSKSVQNETYTRSEQTMTTHDAVPLQKRVKRVKSFHAWHPPVKEMYTGSEPVSGNRADPANRFVGTNAIRQNYASVTPGQGSVAGEIAVAKYAPEKVDYTSSMTKKTHTEVDQSKEDLGQKNLASIRKALGGIRESVDLNESFAAGFELAPFARDYGITVQSSFEHHPEVQAFLDAQEDAMNEAIYQGRQVQLNKPMKGDVKKSKVYVRDPSTGNIKKVNFGDKKLSIKKDQPARKRSYCARSSGQGNLTKKTSANYWSRRAWDC